MADTQVAEPKLTGVDADTEPKTVVESNADDRSTDTLAVETNSPVERKSARPRNYSHLDRDPETLDEVQGCDGKTYKIPATMGSNYWGVLVAMYENVNKPVYPDALVKRVDEVMSEQDEESWDAFCNKAQTTVFKRCKGQREIQPIKPWQDRIINNAKTLTRYKDYGKRLYERGHVLRYEYDGKSQPYFILHTSLDCIKTAKKAETPKVAEEATEKETTDAE